MMASVASRAPSTPPLTGQSRNSTPAPATFGHRAGRIGTHGGTVDDQLPGSQSGLKGVDDGQHIRIGGDAQHHDVRVAGQLGRRRGSGAPQFGRQVRSLRPGAIPERREQAGLVKIAGHVRAHRAQTQEPDAHRAQLLAPPAQASSIA
jgi:hypothetical protein